MAGEQVLRFGLRGRVLGHYPTSDQPFAVVTYVEAQRCAELSRLRLS